MKFRSVQVLRAVAATAVVVCHSTKGFPLGAAGVDLFFVISGFIIGKVMVGRDAPSFLFDRFWRIFPPYWLASIPWFLIALNLGMADAARNAASLTLWPVYDELARPYLRPAWSLLFEVLFYLSAAAAISLGTWRPLILSFAVLCALNLVSPSPLAGFLGFPLILEFLFGLAIGKMDWNRRIAALLLPLALVGLLTAPASLYESAPLAVGDKMVLQRALWWGIPAAIIVYAGLAFESLFAKWADLAVFLGNASYSIYLTHLTILIVLSGWVAVPVCLAIGAACHVWIERPLLRMSPKRMIARAYAGIRPKEMTP